MDHLALIQKTLDYIEENLRTTITLEELSAIAGFSPFHYCRLFRQVVGLGTAQYLSRRRLLWAAYDIAQGRRVIDAALDYGFDTASGFCRAFRRTFGCVPTVYARRFRARAPYRVHLLQEEHIMLSEKKLRTVLAHWDMQGARICSVPRDAGNLSENVFAVGDRHFLKVFTTPARVQLGQDIAAALTSAGIGAALPEPARDGALSVTDGELYFALTRRVPGERLCAAELLSGTGVAPRELGVTLGRLHQVLSDCPIPARDHDILREVRETWFDRVREILGLDETFCADYLAALERYQDLPTQLIHRDPNPNNLLVHEGRISGFLDFDLSQRSIRLLDLCYACTGILAELDETLTPGLMIRWTALWHEVLAGYDEAAHLTADEKAAAKYVLLAVQFICVGYFSSLEKFAALAQTNIRMTRAMLKVWDRL